MLLLLCQDNRVQGFIPDQFVSGFLEMVAVLGETWLFEADPDPVLVFESAA